MKKAIYFSMIFSLLFFLFQLVAFAESEVFENYLMDVGCAKKAITDDGANLQTNPEKHTVACLKKPDCIASGYGIIIREKETGKYNFYKFDEKGNEIAKKLIEATKKTDNMQIIVRGNIDKKGEIIKVESIIEK